MPLTRRQIFLRRRVAFFGSLAVVLAAVVYLAGTGFAPVPATAASSAAVAGTGAKPVPARYTTAARTTAREPKKATRRRRKIWRLVSGIRQFYRRRTRLHAQGVQGDRAGRGHVERIDTVEHGDRDDRVGGGQRLAAEPVADTVVTIPMLHGVDSLN